MLELPGLRVVTANLLPAHAALLEGDEEVVLTDAAELRIPFISNQPQYSLLWRVIESEVVGRG